MSEGNDTRDVSGKAAVVTGRASELGRPLSPGFLWNPIFKDGQKVGDLTNCAFSIRVQTNLGFALIPTTGKVGDRLETVVSGKTESATLVVMRFL